MIDPTPQDAAALLVGIFLDEGVVPKRGLKQHITENDLNFMITTCCARIMEQSIMLLAGYDREAALAGLNMLIGDVRENIKTRQYDDD